MKKFLLLLSLLPIVAMAQPFPPATTVWSRSFLRQTNAGDARTALGVSLTNNWSSDPTQFATNADNLLAIMDGAWVTNVQGSVSNLTGTLAADGAGITNMQGTNLIVPAPMERLLRTNDYWYVFGDSRCGNDGWVAYAKNHPWFSNRIGLFTNFSLGGAGLYGGSVGGATNCGWFWLTNTEYFGYQQNKQPAGVQAHAIVWLGANDGAAMMQGPLAYYQKMTNFLNALKTNGLETVVINHDGFVDTGGYYYRGWLQARNLINTYLAQDPSGLVDILVDVASFANNSYDKVVYADSVHFTAGGYRQIGKLVIEALQGYGKTASVNTPMSPRLYSHYNQRVQFAPNVNYATNTWWQPNGLAAGGVDAWLTNSAGGYTANRNVLLLLTNTDAANRHNIGKIDLFPPIRSGWTNFVLSVTLSPNCGYAGANTNNSFVNVGCNTWYVSNTNNLQVLINTARSNKGPFSNGIPQTIFITNYFLEDYEFPRTVEFTLYDTTPANGPSNSWTIWSMQMWDQDNY